MIRWDHGSLQCGPFSQTATTMTSWASPKALVSPSRSSGGKGKGKRGDKGKGGNLCGVFLWRKIEKLEKFRVFFVEFSLLDLNFLLVPTPTWRLGCLFSSSAVSLHGLTCKNHHWSKDGRVMLRSSNGSNLQNGPRISDGFQEFPMSFSPLTGFTKNPEVVPVFVGATRF